MNIESIYSTVYNYTVPYRGERNLFELYNLILSMAYDINNIENAHNVISNALDANLSYLYTGIGENISDITVEKFVPYQMINNNLAEANNIFENILKNYSL